MATPKKTAVKSTKTTPTTGWDRLHTTIDKAEAKLESLAKRLETKTGQARVQTSLGLKELEASWHGLEEKFMGQIAKLMEAEKQLHAASDRTRVKLHLAKADAKDAAKAAKTRVVAMRRRLTRLAAKA